MNTPARGVNLCDSRRATKSGPGNVERRVDADAAVVDIVTDRPQRARMRVELVADERTATGCSAWTPCSSMLEIEKCCAHAPKKNLQGTPCVTPGPIWLTAKAP